MCPLAHPFLIVWRIVVGLSLIPAFGTLYQRLTLPESTRYLKSTKTDVEEDPIEELKRKANASTEVPEKADASNSSNASEEGSSPAPVEEPAQTTGHKSHLRGESIVSSS